MEQTVSLTGHKSGVHKGGENEGVGNKGGTRDTFEECVTSFKATADIDKTTVIDIRINLLLGDNIYCCECECVI